MRVPSARHSAWLLSLFLVLTGFAPSPAGAAPIRRAAEPVPGQYIVVLSPLTADVSSVATQLADQYDGKVLAVWKRAVKGFWVAISPENATRLAADGRVESMEEDAVVKSSGERDTTVGPYQTLPGFTFPEPLHPLWHLARINNRVPNDPTERKYRYRLDGNGVRVYLIDSGVWKDHQEFLDQHLETGYNASQFPLKYAFNIDPVIKYVHPVPVKPDVSPANNPCSGDGRFPRDLYISHGTATAGMVIGKFVGVAPGATLVPVTSTGCIRGERAPSAAALVGALEWVLDEISYDEGEAPSDHLDPATTPAVVSMSTFRSTEELSACGSASSDCLTMPDLRVLEKMVNAISGKGVPVIVSANNLESDACHGTPARLSARGGLTIDGSRTGVITVGATTPADDRWPSSNFGQCVDLWAPGEHIALPEPVAGGDLPNRTDEPSRYRATTVSGTSFSAPIVAGIVARMMAEDPTLYATPASTADKVRRRLLANATDLSRNSGQNDGAGSPDELAYLGFAGTFTEARTPSVTILDGETAPVVLTAPLVGSGDFNYQWYRNDDVLIAGATEDTYTLDPAPTMATHGGAGQRYSLEATRTRESLSDQTAIGQSVTSAGISVRVTTARINEQPVSFWPENAAQARTLKARVEAVEPYRVQWLVMDSQHMQATVSSFTGTVHPATGLGNTALVEHTVSQGDPVAIYKLAILPASCVSTSCIVYSESARVAKWIAIDKPALTIGTTPVDPAVPYYIDLYRHNADCTPDVSNFEQCKLDGQITATAYPGRPIQYSWDWKENVLSNWAPLYIVPNYVTETQINGNQYTFKERSIWPREPGYYSVSPGDARTSTRSDTVHVASYCSFDYVGNLQPSIPGSISPDRISAIPADELENLQFTLSGGSVCLMGVQRFQRTRGSAPAIPVAPPQVSTQWSVSGPACGYDSSNSFTGVRVENIVGPTRITLTATDAISHCQRVLHFNLTDGTLRKKLSVLAGECQVNAAPTVIDRMNARVRLKAEVRPGTVGLELPANLANDSTFVWSFNGATLQSKLGRDGGETYWHTVNHVEARDILLTVQPPGTDWTTATVTVHVQPIDEACQGPQCTTVCKTRSVRHNGVPTSFHAFAPGESGVLGAPEEDPSYAYEWHRTLENGTDEIIGTSGTVGVVMTEAARYWVVTTEGGARNDSDLLTTVPSTLASGDVTVTPAYQVITTADSATVTASFEHADANTRYQWRVGGSYDENASVIETGDTLTIANITDDTVVWCRVIQPQPDDSVVYYYSPFATIMVNCSPAIEGNITVTPQRVARNQEATLQLSTSGAKFPTYSWYRQLPNGSTEQAGASAILRTTVTEPATVFGAVVTDVCGNSVGLNEKTVYLCVPTIDEQPEEHQIVKAGEPVTVGLEASPAITGQPVTITWYRSGYNNGNGHPVVGSGPSFNPTLTAGTTETYYATVSSTCADGGNGTVYSEQATVEVCSPPVITGQSSDTNLTQSESTTIVVVATGTDLTYQWYQGLSGDTSHPLNGWTDDSEEFTPSQTTSYWCRVTSRGVCTVDSSAITVHVCVPPSITTQPQGTKIHANGTATLSVSVDNSGNTDPLGYQWQRQTGVDQWQNISGATAASFTTPALTEETTYRVLVTVGDCQIASAAATVSICALPAVLEADEPETLTTPGESATLHLIIASSYNSGIHWYEGESGVKTATAGSGPSITVSPLTTKTYWAEIESDGCTTRTTNYTVRVCKPAITSQPSGSSIASGDPVTLSVGTAALTGQTFQWYTGTPGTTTSPVSGATSASLTVNPTATTSYWVRVTGTCSTSVDSTAATVSVCNPPAITALAPNRSIQQGNSTTLDVSATGSTLTYKWYVGTTGTTTNPIANATNPSVSVSPSTTTNYWVQIKSAGLCVTNSATITVDVCTTPVITAQPQAQTIRTGQSATLSVTTSASGATYQWYEGAPGTTTTPLGTAASISVSPANDTQYWVRITRGACTADSAGATVTVCKLTASVANVNAASGQNVTLTATVTNARGSLTHWWYRGNSGDTSVLVDAGTLPQITVSRTANTNYWVRVTDNTCTIDSATATVSICIPTITAQPQNVVVTSGQTTTLSVSATGSPLTYQWYIGDSGVTANPVVGATSSSYTTPSMTAETKYWVRVSGCSNLNSAAATVTVCIPPSITAGPSKSGGQYATNTGTLSVTAAGTGLSYQWYKGQSGDTSRPMSGATTASHSFTLSVSEYYWVRITGSCGSIDSSAILYSVTPAITAQPQSATVPSGTRVPLSVTATGNFLTYQWYLGTGSSNPISGATAASYLTPPVTATTTYWVKVLSGSTSVNSSQVTATLCTGPGISFTKTSQGSHSWKLTVNITNPDDLGLVKYQWYTGTAGDVTQSTAQGPITWTNYKYFYNLTESQTWWVRVWYDDDSCFTDSGAQTVN